MKAKLLTCLLLAMLSTACASGNTIARVAKADAEAERYRQYALAPVDGFTAFSFDNWSSVSRNQVVIWPRMNEAYLLTVWDTCFNLPFAQRIGISRTGTQVTKFDKLIVGHDRCPISEIRPIDVKKMKADQEAARRAAGPAAAP